MTTHRALVAGRAAGFQRTAARDFRTWTSYRDEAIVARRRGDHTRADNCESMARLFQHFAAEAAERSRDLLFSLIGETS